MDYEQEYKAALKRASIIYTGKYKPEIAAFCKQTLEAVFPELEDYSDMRIIEEITFFLKQKGGYNKDWIAWLENLAPTPQGKSALEAIKEEKIDNANKVETKFHEGEYIVDVCGYLWRVVEIINQFYVLESIEGGESRPTIEWVDNTFHHWTTHDAKEGDILVDCDDKFPFIFKGLIDPNHPNYPVAYCGINNIYEFQNSSGEHWWTSDSVKPATKEQRDLLFQKMKEAGYEWDADNKYLINI